MHTQHFKPMTRLYVMDALTSGTRIAFEESQSHYLGATLRARGGEDIALFNGRDGEWRATLVQAGKRAWAADISEQVKPQAGVPDVWLAFAPVKNEKIDYTVKRATELGVSALLPVMTRHTIVSRINTERLRANIIEAAEQCGRLEVPELHAAVSLEALLSHWPKERLLLHADESGQGKSLPQVLSRVGTGVPAAILIGPEGGFSPEERALLKTLPFVHGFSLGPRILRAETAALAALACVQAHLGDWENPPYF